MWALALISLSLSLSLSRYSKQLIVLLCCWTWTRRSRNKTCINTARNTKTNIWHIMNIVWQYKSWCIISMSTNGYCIFLKRYVYLKIKLSAKTTMYHVFYKHSIIFRFQITFVVRNMPVVIYWSTINHLKACLL